MSRPRHLVARAIALVFVHAMLAAPGARADHPIGLFDQCGDCHDAKGWRTLRDDAKALDHARTGFRLLGRHAQVACTECHRSDRVLAGRGTELCATCHADRLHRGALGNDCSRCHADTTWRIPQGRAIHAGTRFPLTGAHLAADCTGCHLRADQAVYTDAPVACIACHQQAYVRPGNNPDHVGAGFSTECALCHRASAWRPSRFRHAIFFPLVGAHAPLACEACHAGGRFGGTPRTCDGCHVADYRAAQNPNHAMAGFPMDCAQCHGPSSWRPAKSDWHDAVFLVTRGKHQGIPCAHCHTTPGNFTMFRCVSCHSIDKTMPQHQDVAGFMQEDRACLQCHARGLKKG